MSKPWPDECAKLLDDLMDNMKRSIMADAENFAVFHKRETIDFEGLEAGLYKSMATLHEVNKSSIIKKYGLENGLNLVENLERHAKLDITNIVYNDIKKAYGGEIPPEIQELIDMMKGEGLDFEGNNEEKE